VRHLLLKNPDLDPEKRAELIQVLLCEGSLHEAQKMIPNSEKKGLMAKALRILPPVFGGQSGTEEAMKKEMKKIASAVSDSEFLLGLKSIEIEGLHPAIQEAETFAHTSLLSSIADTVKKMTHAVLHMQQDSCKKEIQKKVQTNEARVMSGALVNFIRDLNAKSAGRKDS
jgi:CHASE3 domain sensor protein